MSHIVTCVDSDDQGGNEQDEEALFRSDDEDRCELIVDSGATQHIYSKELVCTFTMNSRNHVL